MHRFSKFSSIVLVSLVSVCSYGGLLARVTDQANKVETTYAEIWNGFFGVDHMRTLLEARLDVRPDGTPNIVIDEASGSAVFTIRLAVNDSAYAKWKDKAHRSIDQVGLSYRFSEFEDPDSRIIGGKAYHFGNNEEAAIKRWEQSGKGKKANVSVRIEAVDATGNVLHKWDVPLRQFGRLGYDSYPIPLHNLNRLKDLPSSVFAWVKKGADIESGVEDAYTTVSWSGMTPQEMSDLEDIRCTVFDDEGFEVAVEKIQAKAEAERIEAARRAEAERARAEAARIQAERLAEAKGLEAKRLLKAQRPSVQALLDQMVDIPGKDFKMCKYECTQSLWEAFMGQNPSKFKGSDRPVEKVSWNDCQAFLKKLNEHPDIKKSGLAFRLPTKEEWEYSCAAGAEKRWGFCKMADGTEITEETIDRVAWTQENSGSETHPVGQKEPNAFGLYDIHGNVWEWTDTKWSGGNRWYAGGGWKEWDGGCRINGGQDGFPFATDDDMGLRLAASPAK